MLEFLFSAAGGGLFGTIGGLLKHFLELRQEAEKRKNDLELAKEMNSHEVNMYDKQIELIKLEAANALTLAELNKTKEENISWNESVASLMASDKATYAVGDKAKDSKWFIFVDVVRGLIRPGITIYFDILLSILGIWVLYTIFNVYPTLLANEEFIKLTFTKLLDAVIMIGTTATMFWFIARPNKK